MAYELISQSRKLNKRGKGRAGILIRPGALENFLKENKRGGGDSHRGPESMVTTKINKTIGILRKLQKLLPRTALITIYNAFIRPHLDYGDILYDQAFNLSF